MKKERLARPSIEGLVRVGRTIFREFDPKKFLFLNSRGQWGKDPETPPARIISELLFETWKLEDKERISFIKELFSPFVEENSWRQSKKIKFGLMKIREAPGQGLSQDEVDREIIRSYSAAGRSENFYPFLLILDVLSWLLHYQAVLLGTEGADSDWDVDGKAFRQECAARLQSLHHFSINLSPECQNFISRIFEEFKKTSFKFIAGIPRIICDEERLTTAINCLVEQAKDRNREEEVFSLVVEKIQPPMGIVTLATSSFLRPCLRLLMEESLNISSGIQHAAAVMLSILQDSRSTETLLEAMGRFPLHYSKIRENLIYTLGSLREKKAAAAIAQVLESPDEVKYSDGEKGGIQSTIDQKKEALWALGKIGLESVKHLPTLVKYAEHPSLKLKTYLAWALGEIGKAEKEKLGGVSADTAITLLKLLKTKNRQVFEEAVSALKKFDMPEFTHSLYLYHIGAVSLLGLKPAQKGLYELSETLYHLFQSKKRAIVAVNGDSGTGKTYFCQAIADGFGELKEEDILYLMRDRKRDQKIFNRMIGLKWLKRYIDSSYYHDYPLSEDKDDPEEYFRQFLEKNSNKKLIILDGCRDRHYFQRVIDLFYGRDELDVEVNFRATLSTRRLNLEQREMALESVETHLSFLEEPALEDTHLYQEGKVILYDLDNSIPHRLSSRETRELFEKRKIDTWGELIRVGDFKGGDSLIIEDEKLSIRQKDFCLKDDTWPEPRVTSFKPEERKFKAELNEDLADEPNLLQTIEADDLKPKQIRFYAQDQVSGTGEEGAVFVITFLDSRIFHAPVEKSSEIRLLGRDIFLVTDKGKLINVSFERNEIAEFGNLQSPVLSLASSAAEKLVSGHEDGSIRIWDFRDKKVEILEGHLEPVISLVVDYSGGIYSASRDKTLRHWDRSRGAVSIIEGITVKPSQLKRYPQGKILAVTDSDKIVSSPAKESTSRLRILDFKKANCQSVTTPPGDSINSASVYFDGRIIAVLSPRQSKTMPGNLAVIDPQKDFCIYHLLSGHSQETKDCFVTGPKILSCGKEADGSRTFRVWGTEFYVRMELNKLSLR